MKNKSKEKFEMGREKPGKEKQSAKYGDEEWQNPQYGEKKDCVKNKACGCGAAD
jgi:hypothetical protein